MEAIAKLKNYPTSPRKMRLLADLIRGEEVETALAILEHNPKHPAVPLRKLVLSAIDNWKHKNEGGDETGLVVKTIFVDGARTLKRMRPAPQGRGYRVRKRSNHVTVVVDSKFITPVITEPVKEEPKAVEETVIAEKKESKAKKPAAKKTAEKKTTKKKTK
ncbi:MAG: 50S ribosomal protein L22 [Chitinophagaceae bacterium]|jgi:large subunit ribosomal protein L22|nr:50S ribosomal protein L22 [Chitinophagaceae bacterium]OQY93891.1 MAG: 50S ribosomal protein L22 [Sphingobacteriales bacterium UTBCD1]